MAEIKVIRIKKTTTNGNIKAFCDIQIGKTEFYDFKVVQQPDQKPWISTPTAQWNKDGTTKYKQLIKFPDELKKQIDVVVLKAFESD